MIKRLFRLALLSFFVLLLAFLFKNGLKTTSAQVNPLPSFNQHFSQLVLPFTSPDPGTLEAVIPIPNNLTDKPINISMSTDLIVNGVAIGPIVQNTVVVISSEILPFGNSGTNWVNDEGAYVYGDIGNGLGLYAGLNIGPVVRNSSGNFVHVQIVCIGDCTNLNSTSNNLRVNMLY